MKKLGLALAFGALLVASATVPAVAPAFAHVGPHEDHNECPSGYLLGSTDYHDPHKDHNGNDHVCVARGPHGETVMDDH